MKDRLIASPVGPVLLRLRSQFALRSLSRRNPERASAVANAILCERLIAELPEPGSNFLDIGAHIGSVLSAVHRADRTVNIFAIEADPAKLDRLRRNFPFCTFTGCAVGEASGTAEFFRHPARSGFNSLAASDADGVIRTAVEVRTLDEIFPEQVFRTIKIDIEGAELGALRGGRRMIARSRPVILFESAGTGTNALGYDAGGLFDWFAREGFEVFLPDRLAHDAPGADRQVFLDAHHYPVRSLNFFAVPAERRIEVRDRARAILGIGRNGG